MTTIACLPTIQYIFAEIITADGSITHYIARPRYVRGVYWVAGVAFLGNYSVRSGIIDRAKYLDTPSIQSFKYLYPA
jgi:hypothetical protein